MAGKSTFKAPDLQNPDKLGKPLLKALLIHLGRLGEIDAQVAADVIRYVVDADPEEVLLKLGGLSEADKELLLAGVTRRAGAYARFVIACKERLAIVRAGEKAPPSLWIRLGQVFEAVWRFQDEEYASARLANLAAGTAGRGGCCLAGYQVRS